MAHVEHYKRSDVKRLANEWERQQRKDGSWKFTPTGEIDESRTHLNYRMVPGESVTDRLSARLASVKVDKRKHVNVISDWAITCPEELKADPEQVRRFFALSWSFLEERYGAENCLQGYVHMDETSPHMHAVICPVKDGRVSAKALFTRRELSDFHKELDARCAEPPPEGFGMKGLVKNGRTKGGYTTKELKERTAREEELSRRAGAVTARETKANCERLMLDARERALEARESDLERREAELQAERQEALKTAQKTAERQERERQALNERRRQLADWENELEARENALPAAERAAYVRKLEEAQAARTAKRSEAAALIAPTVTPDANPRRGKRAGKIQRSEMPESPGV